MPAPHRSYVSHSTGSSSVVSACCRSTRFAVAVVIVVKPLSFARSVCKCNYALKLIALLPHLRNEISSMSSNNGINASKSQKLIAYLGRVLTPVSFDKYDEFNDGVLLVDEEGKLVAVGNKAPILAKHKVHSTVDFGQRILLPGLIDLHIHLVQV